MKEFKGTLGPWRFDGVRCVIAEDETIVIGDYFGTVLPLNGDPDWKLIAAAPELLEALCELVKCVVELEQHYDFDSDTLVEDARAAINKALGETK